MDEIKLLIVDDEYETREGLVSCLSAIRDESISIRTAGDGIKALETANTFIPDVLLCDIRMPRMDGLELAAVLMKKNELLRIIFISGYADKEYLKTAVKLKADGYVEKPIEIDELLETVRKSINLYKKTQRDLSDKAKLENIADVYSGNQLIRAFLSSPVTLHELKSRLSGTYEFWPEANDYISILYKLDWQSDDEKNVREAHILQLQGLIEREFALTPCHDTPKTLCGIFADNLIAIFVPYSVINHNTLAQKIENFFLLLPSRMRHLFHLRAIISRKANSLERIAEAFAEAYSTAGWLSFVESKKKIVFCDFIKSMKAIEDRSGRFRDCLERMNSFLAIQIILDQTCQLMDCEHNAVDTTIDYFELLLRICLETESATRHYTENERHVLSTFSHLQSLKKISQFIIHIIEDMYPNMLVPLNISSKSHEVIQYIWEHISDPMLSILTISERLQLSKNYLNSLFKMETGKSIHKTILEIRVECAKHLLIQNYKLYEVAQMVGFTSSTYFSTVFKKSTGISPTKYRKSEDKSPEKDDAI